MLNKNDEIKINKAIDGIIIEISERLPKEDKELEIAFEETEQITFGIVKNRINNLLLDLEFYLQTEALKKEIFSTSENQVLFYKKNLFKKVKEENGFFSSLEDSISNGLIKGLSNLISDSGMFNKIVDDIPEERKAIRIDRGRIERGDKTENNSRAENKSRVDNSSDKSSQKKGKIGKILEKIISFFKGNKHKKMEQ